MRINLCEVRKCVVSITLFAGFALCISGFCQNSIPLKAGITSITAFPQVIVEITVRAADKQLVIPYCKVASAGENILYCNQGLEHSLEFLEGKKWILTMPGYAGEIFGVDDGAWEPAVIAPGESKVFTFTFNPEFYHLHKGQHLKLIIQAWKSAEALKNNEKPSGRFTSAVFLCP